MSKNTSKKYLEKQRKKALKKEACKPMFRLEDGSVFEAVLVEMPDDDNDDEIIIINVD